MARQKKVFSSNSEVCHVWAQQTQNEGNANNVFFVGNTIYSYGYHFPMAKIHTFKGKRYALITSNGYSISTHKHKGHVWSALNGLMPCFYSDNLDHYKNAISGLDNTAKNSIADQLKKVKIVSIDGVNWNLNRINEVYEEASKCRKFFGLKPIKASKKDLDKVEEHLETRLKRYHELNTPEMLAKKEKKRLEKEVKAEQEKQKNLELSINTFREGAYPTYSLSSLKHELLRVKDDEVQTSRGARVPLVAARVLHQRIVAGKDVKGLKIGSYTVVCVIPYNDDKIIQIGCHRILLSEATKVLGF